MKLERLLVEGRLWDEPAVIRRAMECYDKAPWFADLSPSQLGALERAVAHAKGPNEFLRELRRYTGEAVRRGKGRTTWTQENAVQLSKGFEDAVAAVQKSSGKLAEAYQECKKKMKLDAEAARALDAERDEAVLRTFLEKLAKLKRAKEAK